jgi:saccharopine dehydrogenase-like NADP-dependent oxidoreductase
MKKKLKILILGKGKIGLAVSQYLKKFKAAKKVAFFNKEKGVKNFDILIGALPSEVADKGLELALKYKKDLIDVSALPIPFYLKHKKEILKKGIRVIPGCGVSPGLVNLIVGFESNQFEKIKSIEIDAGTLPQNSKFLFPFTWCFEDLIEQHLYKASIVQNGKKINLPPFSGYKKEKLKEVGEFDELSFISPSRCTQEFESYFVEEWSTLFYSLKPKNISFRVIRPIGFFHFFQYLKNYGFFKKKNLLFVKKILTRVKVDNVTLVRVKISGIKKGKRKKVIWEVFSFAKARENLNSMQKITGIIPAITVKLLSKGEIKDKGLIFMENLGKDKKLFKEIRKKIEDEKSILVKS